MDSSAEVMRTASNDFATLRNLPPIKWKILQSLHWWREDDIVWEHKRQEELNSFLLSAWKTSKTLHSAVCPSSEDYSNQMPIWLSRLFQMRHKSKIIYMNSSLSKKKLGKKDYLVYLSLRFFNKSIELINSTWNFVQSILVLVIFTTTSSRCIHAHSSVMAARDDVESLLTHILCIENLISNKRNICMI